MSGYADATDTGTLPLARTVVRLDKSEQECLPGNLRRGENCENATVERHPRLHMEDGLADVGNGSLIRSYLQRVPVAETQALATLATDHRNVRVG